MLPKLFVRIISRVVSLPDEAGVVYIDEGGHKELTVKPVHNTTVTWDGVTKVLQTYKNILVSDSDKSGVVTLTKTI